MGRFGANVSIDATASDAGVVTAAPKSVRTMAAEPRAPRDPDLEGFLALLGATRAPRTVDAYRRDLTDLATRLDRPLHSITTEELERYLAELRAEGRAPATIARRTAAARSFFRHLVLLGRLTENPAAAVTLPRKARRLPKTLSPSEAEILTGVLEKVVQEGTGTRAQLPGREVAGKTGTNDNYADAWFVGYTPDLVVAVWVGYPNQLKPMETEFHGEPVAGGTLPALIWKAFMGRALAGKPATTFS